MSLQQNKAAIRRFYAEVINKGNLDAMADVFNYDAEMNTTAIPEDPEPEYGIDRLKPAFIKMREAFPGLQATIEDLFGEGDRVVARANFYGHLPGEPNTPGGKHLLWTSVDVFRMHKGKVAEQFGSQDNVHLLRDNGVVPLKVTKPITAMGSTTTGFSTFAPQNPAKGRGTGRSNS
ncbi:MAG: putative ester cyclase [Chloroflexi bacterium]|jgi:predicted ester cyclase|nr:MAG: putative ester cyclase [Chloroflexota bacterium]